MNAIEAWNTATRALSRAALVQKVKELHKELKVLVLSDLKKCRSKIEKSLQFIKKYKKDMTLYCDVSFLSAKPDFGAIEKLEGELLGLDKEVVENIAVIKKLTFKTSSSESEVDTKMRFLVEKQRLLLGYDSQFRHKVDKDVDRVQDLLKTEEKKLEYVRHLYTGMKMTRFKIKHLF